MSVRQSIGIARRSPASSWMRGSQRLKLQGARRSRGTIEGPAVGSSPQALKRIQFFDASGTSELVPFPFLLRRTRCSSCEVVRSRPPLPARFSCGSNSWPSFCEEALAANSCADRALLTSPSRESAPCFATRGPLVPAPISCSARQTVARQGRGAEG